MNVLKREFYGLSRRDVITIIPLGDIHIGAAACDENLFRRTVKHIQETGAYWFGLGDYCEFINVSDPRFNSSALADWVQMKHLGDLAAAQRDRFLDIVKPIASKCLGLICGNHEGAILRHYERDIFSEIVTGVKAAGGFEPEHKLSLGGYGWCRLTFRRTKKGKNGAVVTVDVNLHHGFVGGRLAGAKALNMQRWLWTHEADLVIFGHSHNTASQAEATERLDGACRPVYKTRKGVYAGTFLKNGTEGVTTYSERKGYFPLPVGGVEIRIKPGDADKGQDFIKVIV